MPTAPLALIAELTHRCPLRCVYCSNPLELRARSEELSTETWVRAFEEAAQLGTLHVHLTGGEPLARGDLTPLVLAARSAGLYTNLITSGIGLNEKRLSSLVEAGLDHIQLSFQDAEESSADTIAGCSAHVQKVAVARLISETRLAFTVNLVVHRRNLDRLEEIISFAERLRPHRIEIAHVQYYGCRGTRERKAERDQDRLCDAGLLRNIPQTLHGRLGPPAHGCRSFRQSPAVPRRRRDPRPGIRKRERKVAALDLGRVFVIPAIPRRRLDAGAMPHLREAHPGLRGLPLPGFSGHGRCSRYRPRLLAFTPPPPD